MLVLPVADSRAAILPRDNGELVFEAPWQARALVIAVALTEKLGLPWDAFRRRLKLLPVSGEHDDS